VLSALLKAVSQPGVRREWFLLAACGPNVSPQVEHGFGENNCSCIEGSRQETRRYKLKASPSLDKQALLWLNNTVVEVATLLGYRYARLRIISLPIDMLEM
jgi:hypothetical protein